MKKKNKAHRKLRKCEKGIKTKSLYSNFYGKKTTCDSINIREVYRELFTKK
jgi:hypothetical protein